MRGAAAFLVLAAACGDPIVGPGYLGTPALALSGTVRTVEAPRAAPAENVRLSLFWIGFDSRARARPVMEQNAALDAQLTSFTMTLFDTPPSEALTFEDLSRGAGVGLALIVLYADNNQNGLLNSYVSLPDEGPDTVLGASAAHVVAYASAPVAAGTRAAELLGPITAGFHLYTSSSPGVCPFARATSCPPEGTLTEIAQDVPIEIGLYGSAEAVRVPSPRLAGSGTSQGGSIYGGH